MPLIIGDKVQDTADEVWQLTLQLKDIVELICAQKISVSQVAYLDVLIQEYLEFRKVLFPETTLKPKHHYLRHYPALILKFGPLIRLWTMRFESKHSYFKQCARHLKNFKNICHTFSQRHQMLQAYLLEGSVYQTLQVKESSVFYCELYSEPIKDAVRLFGFTDTNTRASEEIEYKGTLYKRGQFLVTRNVDSMEFGELLLIFLKHDTIIHFLMRVFIAEFLPDYHMYSVHKQSDTIQCVNISDLADFYPLSSYMINGHQVVPLKHSIFSH